MLQSTRGPRDFAVVLGQSAFYAGLPAARRPRRRIPVTAALAAKDLVAVDRLRRGCRTTSPPAQGHTAPRRTCYGRLRHREAGRFAVGEGGREAPKNLREILRHLEAHGALGAVILDLGLIGRHDHYTGAVYEAYASGLGFTVANGGRYDNFSDASARSCRRPASPSTWKGSSLCCPSGGTSSPCSSSSGETRGA